MENTTKKIVLIILIALFSCEENDKHFLIKENLYKTKDEQIVMKLLNKKVRHPSKDAKWEDTIYQSSFRFEDIDSVVLLKDIIDIKTYKITENDTYFEDKNYIYINAYYKPGENQYKIVKKDSNTIFINKDTLKTVNKSYYKGNIIK